MGHLISSVRYCLPVDVQNIISGDLIFLKTGTGKNKTDHVGIITKVNREDGKVTSYDVTHASSGKGRNTRTVRLDNKTDIFNTKLVGFGTIDPATDPLRPNASFWEKIKYFFKDSKNK